MLSRLRQWSFALKRDAHAIYLAARDPRVPWHAKALGIAVAAYAFSPIDLIPDFVPVLGYLDNLIIVPLGIALAVKLIPPELMREHRARATAAQNRPVSIAGATLIVMVWLAAMAFTTLAAYRCLSPPLSHG